MMANYYKKMLGFFEADAPGDEDVLVPPHPAPGPKPIPEPIPIDIEPIGTVLPEEPPV